MGALQVHPYMGPSLYARFLKEVHGHECLEHEWGWASYEVGTDYVYIIDIYVLPEVRSAGKGVQLMREVDAIGKKAGCEWAIGSVAVDSKEAEKNYIMLKDLGYEDWRTTADTIYLRRFIGEPKSE